jgi:hypothetical protein
MSVERLLRLCVRCSLVAAMMAAISAATGCVRRPVGSFVDAERLSNLPVAHAFLCRSGLGSATFVSPDHALIAAHQLEDVDSEPPLLRIDGKLTRFELLRRGGAETPRSDYALIRVLDVRKSGSPIAYDPVAPIRVGDVLYLVGYPGDPKPSRGAHGEVRRRGRVAFPTCVTRVSTDGAVVRVAPSVLEGGMSGGAAVRLDAETQEVSVIGIAVGTKQFLGVGYEDVVIRPRVEDVVKGALLSQARP